MSARRILRRAAIAIAATITLLTASPVTSTSAITGSCPQWRLGLRYTSAIAGGWDVPAMSRLMWERSGCRPTAETVRVRHGRVEYATGLFQIRSTQWRYLSRELGGERPRLRRGEVPSQARADRRNHDQPCLAINPQGPKGGTVTERLSDQDIQDGIARLENLVGSRPGSPMPIRIDDGLKAFREVQEWRAKANESQMAPGLHSDTENESGEPNRHRFTVAVEQWVADSPYWYVILRNRNVHDQYTSNAAWQFDSEAEAREHARLIVAALRNVEVEQ